MLKWVAAFALMTGAANASGLEVDIAGEANGTIVIDLFEDVAPLHVAQITAIAAEGAYDGVVFHRVIDGFMAQTGDVAHGNMENDFNIGRAGTGGSDLPDLPAEFSKIPHARGSLGAARSANPNSANSQFFINFKDNDFLNFTSESASGWGYAVFGKVTEGMDVVDAIAAVKTGQHGMHGDVPLESVVINSMSIVE